MRAARQVGWNLHLLGRCLWDSGNPRKAAEAFKGALDIVEAKLGADHLAVANTLFELGRCARVGKYFAKA